MKTCWITKYALTTGIFKRKIQKQDGTRIKLLPLLGELDTYYIYKPDWHETRDEAIARAKVMQSKKIAALQRQVTKIAALHFAATP